MSSGVSAISASAANTRSNNRFCTISKRDSGRRVSCRLASGPSFDSSTSSNLCRICSGPRWISTGSARKASAQRSMVSVADHGSSRKIASGSSAAHARDRFGEIAVERGARASASDAVAGDRGEEAAADDVDAERPRLVIVDEGADMGAGADQENALRRNQAGGARMRGDAHDEKALDDQRGERRDIEQHDPAARIFDADLRQKAEHQQADQRHVPQLDGAPGVRLEGEEIRQPVFAAEHVGNGEDARRQHADLDE